MRFALFPAAILAAALAGGPAHPDRIRVYAVDGASALLEAREARIDGGLPPQARAMACAQALFQLSAESGNPFPAGTRILRLFLVGDSMAVVDLSAEALKTPSGPSSETLAAQALVQTLHANLPGLSKVLIMVEGKKRDTLSGHLGLLVPLEPLEDLVKKQEHQP